MDMINRNSEMGMLMIYSYRTWLLECIQEAIELCEYIRPRKIKLE